MNIVEKVRKIVEDFPKIADICNTIHVDFTDDSPTSYGLSSIGDTLLSEDVLGNQTRQHSFLLTSVYSAINDFERQENSIALTELAQWLEQQAGAEITVEIGDETYSGEITQITTANGMLYAIPNENEIDGWQYQLQIIAQYTVE